MSARVTAALWVGAYLRRLDAAGIPAFVMRRGSAEAGEVIVKVATMDGQARALHPAPGRDAWIILTEGAEGEVDAVLSRTAGRDPDLWILEIEDRAGRHLLADMAPR